MLSTTAFLAVAMQCAATVHPSTSLDVARVESGYNPYAIAEIVPKPERKPGDKGFITHMPKVRRMQSASPIRLRRKAADTLLA